MALPTANLVRHFDASVNTGLFKNLTGGLLADNPSDGEAFTYWDDLVDSATDGSRVVMLSEGLNGGVTPSIRWRDDDVMGLPSAEIEDGVIRLKTQGGAGISYAPPTSSAFTVLLAFYIDSAGTYPNSGTEYQNCCLIGGARNTYAGVYIRNNSGTYTLYGYNWDGTADVVSYPITPDEPHVLAFRHEGGNIYLSVDCGSEVSIASGNTSNQTAFYVGDEGNNGTTTADFRGRIGEFAIYSAGLTGADLTDATEYFCNRWLVPDPIEATFAWSKNATVTSSETFAASMDAVARTIHLPNAVVLAPHLSLPQIALPPAATSGYGRLWFEDNGSGKLRLMCQFPTGAAVQIAIEP